MDDIDPHALPRRHLLLSAAALAAGCAAPRRAAIDTGPPPILFVHGNGDSAAFWNTTLWRFESNGWPRERLHALDFAYPLARDLDDRPQPGRSSTVDQRQQLSAAVDELRRRTGAAQVVLIGSSRGGYAIRSLVGAEGAARVSHAILGGTPNHGVRFDPNDRPSNEFNGAGPFLRRLNMPRNARGDEVTPGIRWMTIRSDHNDKFAQPEGSWIGARGVPTNIGHDAPALRGAENVVVAGADHREVSTGAQAFEHSWRFLTGRPPTTLAIVAEARPVLDGIVSGLGLDNRPGGGNFPNNLPLDGARVEVYATEPASGERRGAALHQRQVGADGRWGPFEADPQARYEFVVSAPGFATTHIYRGGFSRSSKLIHLRAERVADADRDALAVVTLTRPRGYFGVPRDEISLDGLSPPAGIPPGVPGVSTAKVRLDSGVGRAVGGAFNGERIVGRAWPTAGNHVVLLELQH